MSEIAKLYESVMSGVAAEKTASVADDVNTDVGPEFNTEFFEKIAAGDEDATSVMNEFITEARAEGVSDDDIESAIAEAHSAAGAVVDGDGDIEASDGYEEQKVAAYTAGSEQAIADVLDEELAKEASVTVEDLMDFELGGDYAEGYKATREAAMEVVTKIAAHRKEAMPGAGAAKKIMGRYKQLLTGSNLGAKGLGTATKAGKSEARKILATRVGTGVGGVGAAAYGASKLKDK